MSKQKTAVIANTVLGRAITIIGWIVTVVMLLSLLGAAMDPDVTETGRAAGAVVVVIIFICLGVFLIFRGSLITKMVGRFKTYITLISVQNMRRLDDLAQAVMKPLAFVQADLQKMIDNKFFVNAAIDYAAGEIVIGGRDQAQAAASPRDFEPYKCSGCGASGTKPKGAPGICEYCGSAN